MRKLKTNRQILLTTAIIPLILTLCSYYAGKKEGNEEGRAFYEEKVYNLKNNSQECMYFLKLTDGELKIISKKDVQDISEEADIIPECNRKSILPEKINED